MLTILANIENEVESIILNMVTDKMILILFGLMIDYLSLHGLRSILGMFGVIWIYSPKGPVAHNAWYVKALEAHIIIVRHF